MIKEVFGRVRKPLNDVLLEATSDLGKYYSRLELAYTKLEKRNRELFDECASYLSKGLKARATVYANEIAEIRKLMSIIQGTQITLERAILRLETFRAVTPTLQDIKGVFSEVKGAIEAVANVMPSLTPELNNLTNSINDLLTSTQISLTPPTPVVIKDEGTEAILKEAADFLKQELERKIPEPPEEVYIPTHAEAIKQRVALTTGGSEVYIGGDEIVIGESGEHISALAEDLVLDYIERNNGEMSVSRCAKELNIPQTRVIQILESLSKKGTIRIE